jgi:hypothetical protein
MNQVDKMKKKGKTEDRGYKPKGCDPKSGSWILCKSDAAFVSNPEQ